VISATAAVAMPLLKIVATAATMSHSPSAASAAPELGSRLIMNMSTRLNRVWSTMPTTSGPPKRRTPSPRPASTSRRRVRWLVVSRAFIAAQLATCLGRAAGR
jgi:hypothetical protein